MSIRKAPNPKVRRKRRVLTIVSQKRWSLSQSILGTRYLSARRFQTDLNSIQLSGLTVAIPFRTACATRSSSITNRSMKAPAKRWNRPTRFTLFVREDDGWSAVSANFSCLTMTMLPETGVCPPFRPTATSSRCRSKRNFGISGSSSGSPVLRRQTDQNANRCSRWSRASTCPVFDVTASKPKLWSADTNGQRFQIKTEIRHDDP